MTGAAAASLPFDVVSNEPEAPTEGASQSGSALRLLLALGGTALVIGGIVWFVRKKDTTAAIPTPTPEPSPLPSLDPWTDIDAMMAKAPQPMPVEAQGDGDTASGIPYVWRIYGGTVEMEGEVSPMFQAIVQYQEEDGSWSFWGDNPDIVRLVAAGSVETGMDKIRIWVDQN